MTSFIYVFFIIQLYIKGDIMAFIYILYNNFVNNQYLHLKLLTITFVKVLFN